MADSRRLGKIEKSAYLRNCLTDRHKIWYDDAVWPSWAFRLLKFQNFKIQDGGGRHLEKSKNRHISATVWPIATKWHDDAQFWGVRPLKISNFKNPRRRRPPCWKIEKSPYLRNSLTDRHEIWHDDARWPSSSFRPSDFKLQTESKNKAV